MRIPECDQKVTGSGHKAVTAVKPSIDGYKAVVSCEAETSTRELVSCSNMPTRIWSALSRSLPPDFRNLLGHRC